MIWQLTAKSGYRRGESWEISDRPILLGRSLGCDVHIDDPTVSRRHCQLYLEGDEVVFRDLGSRNVTLVNGTVVAECRLALGDELSIGGSTFILTRTAEIGKPAPDSRRDSSPSTVTLGKAFREATENDSPDTPAFPSSAKDVFRMFQFGRGLNHAHCEEAFASACVTEVEDLFPSDVTAAIWCGGPVSPRQYPAALDIPEDIVTQVYSAMESGRPSLARYRKKGLLFQDQILACVAPMMVSWQCRGALLVFVGARKYVLNDRDLARLDGIAQAAAPFQVWEELAARRAAGGQAEADGMSARADVHTPRRLESDSGKHTLITGRSSAATSLTARLIHTRSPRADGPYITADCTAIAGDGFKAALAGPGVETKAASSLPGLLEQSNGGTLVLEQLEALPEINQVELAETLRTKAFIPAGAAEPQKYTGLIVATVADEPDTAGGKSMLHPELLELLSRQQILIRPRVEVDASTLNRTPALEPVTQSPPVPLFSSPERARRRKKPDKAQDASLGALANAEKTLVRAVLSQCNGDVARAAQIFGVSPAAIQAMASEDDGYAPDTA